MKPHDPINTGRRDSYYCLGVNDRDLYEWRPQIDRVLRQRLSADHANLFAEAAYDEELGSIDWYSPVDGEARLLSAFEGERRLELEADIAAKLADIRQLTGELSRGDETEQRVASLLESALSFPSKEQVFVVGGKPVITFWGFAPEGTMGRPSTPDFVTAAPDRPPAHVPVQLPVEDAPAAEILVAEPNSRSGWRWFLSLGWLGRAMMGLLVLLALLFLLRGCNLIGLGINLPSVGSGGATSNPPAVSIDELEREYGELLHERDRLLKRYEKQLGQCTPGRKLPPRATYLYPDGRREQGQRSLTLPGIGEPRGPDLAQLPPSLKDLDPPQQGSPQLPGSPPLPDKLPETLDEPQPPEMPPQSPPMDNPPPPPASPSPIPEPPANPPMPPADEPPPAVPEMPPTPAEPSPHGMPGQPPQAPSPAPSEKSDAPGDALSVPQDAQPGSRPEFLEGQWRSTSDLKRKGSNKSQRVEFIMNFDKNGSGNLTLVENGGTRCSAPANAHVIGPGQVYIRTDGAATCPNGTSYQPMEIVCENAAGGPGSVCWADQGDGNRFRVEVRR